MSKPNVAATAYLVVLALGFAAAILYALADMWHAISPITSRELSMIGLGGLLGFAFCGLISDRDYKDLERRGHKVECRDGACQHRDNPWLDVTPARAPATPSANTPASQPSASR